MVNETTSGKELLEKIREAYSNAADNLQEAHPFSLGFDFPRALDNRPSF
ncbi:MAG: hypothetical protein OSB75_05570 [Dehalococcoidia bacterium]|nr:hypothetical protein [Dehalococcoidia bacterium]